MKAAIKAIVIMGVSDTLLKGLTLAPLWRGFFLCAVPGLKTHQRASLSQVRSITLGIVRGRRPEFSNFRRGSAAWVQLIGHKSSLISTSKGVRW